MVLILSINYITAVYRLRYPESYEIFASAQYKIVVRVKHWQTGCYSVTDNFKKSKLWEKEVVTILVCAQMSYNWTLPKCLGSGWQLCDDGLKLSIWNWVHCFQPIHDRRSNSTISHKVGKTTKQTTKDEPATNAMISGDKKWFQRFYPWNQDSGIALAEHTSLENLNVCLVRTWKHLFWPQPSSHTVLHPGFLAPGSHQTRPSSINASAQARAAAITTQVIVMASPSLLKELLQAGGPM